MKPFKRVLCPLDFSEPSRYALDYAVTFARAFNAELILIHVIPDMTQAYSAVVPGLPVFERQRHDDLVMEFNEFTRYLDGSFKKVIRTGTPYLEILQYARRDNIDLIILGARGRSKFERLFLGSTGENVARYADIPVLTVHARPHSPSIIRKILVPIDFSPASYSVLPIVAALARTFKARIDLLHIVEMSHHVSSQRQAEEYKYFEMVRSTLASQWELPEGFAEIETRKFIRHHVGPAGYGILAFAQDWDVDLIAMAARGGSGFPGILLGSVAEKIIRIASLPVLSICTPTVNLAETNEVEGMFNHR